MSSQIKLCEQVIAAHKAKLSTTANKDQVRRQIAAAEARLRQLRAQVTA